MLTGPCCQWPRDNLISSAENVDGGHCSVCAMTYSQGGGGGGGGGGSN